MLLNKQTKRVLHSVNALGGPLIVQAPNRFTIFGKAPNDGIVAQGMLGNVFDFDFAIADVKALARDDRATVRVNQTSIAVLSKDQKTEIPYLDEPEHKLLERDCGRLDGLLDARRVGSFTLREEQVATLKRHMGKAADGADHARFVVSKDGSFEAQFADLRLAFDEAWQYVGGFQSGTMKLSKFRGDPISFSVKSKTFRLLEDADYEVTFYDNGLAEFVSMGNSGVTYLLRDQPVDQLFDKVVTDRPR